MPVRTRARAYTACAGCAWKRREAARAHPHVHSRMLFARWGQSPGDREKQRGGGAPQTQCRRHWRHWDPAPPRSGSREHRTCGHGRHAYQRTGASPRPSRRQTPPRPSTDIKVHGVGAAASRGGQRLHSRCTGAHAADGAADGRVRRRHGERGSGIPRPRAEDSPRGGNGRAHDSAREGARLPTGPGRASLSSTRAPVPSPTTPESTNRDTGHGTSLLCTVTSR